MIIVIKNNFFYNANRIFLLLFCGWLLTSGCSLFDDGQQSAAIDKLQLSPSDPVSYLGREETIKQYSKDLPHYQYDLVDDMPNSKAGVSFNQPDTPILKAYPKNTELNRLSLWLEVWQDIDDRQNLAKQYYSSFKKTKKIDYLVLASDIYRQSITDLQDLQAGSWPNSDYSYEAYKKKVASCQQLDLWAADAFFMGQNIEKSNPLICSTFP